MCYIIHTKDDITCSSLLTDLTAIETLRFSKFTGKLADKLS